jgi:hypothetical protein
VRNATLSLRETHQDPGLSAVLAAVIGLSIPLGISPAGAQAGPLGWREVKCVRYAKAWSEALQRKGAQGLGREFRDRHDAFIASGCTTAPDVCPRSAEELALANIMIIASYNAGKGSTFMPFACRT